MPVTVLGGRGAKNIGVLRLNSALSASLIEVFVEQPLALPGSAFKYVYNFLFNPHAGLV